MGFNSGFKGLNKQISRFFRTKYYGYAEQVLQVELLNVRVDQYHDLVAYIQTVVLWSVE